MDNNFAERLKKALDIRGMKQVDLTELTGLGKSLISQYLASSFEPKQNNIFKIAKALEINPAWLMGKNVDMDSNMLGNNPIRISVYGSIPAGIPLEAIEDIQGWEEIPSEWAKGGQEYIALKVVGDSMYPKYLNGDTIIIQLQPDCETGQDCACYVDGYDAKFKRVIKNNGSITLEPINPNYPPETYTHPGQVNIIGVVKELRRKSY